MKRAILYARVSKDDRDNATSSIDGQLADCREYAIRRGYQVVGEYFEERNKLTSGADWLPELQKVLKLAEQGAFDLLIAWKLDRIARNRFKQLSVKNALKTAGVVIEYAAERYEDTPEGRLQEGLMGELAEYQREQIRARMMWGTRRSVDAGNVKFSSIVTFGYEVVQKDGRRTLAIKEGEAAIVRLIFDLYVNQRMTIYAVANYLDAQGVEKPLSAAKGWSHGTLNNILRNETYAGRWYYGKTEHVKDPVTGKMKRLARPREEWQLVTVPAIVPEALFEAAQKVRVSNKTRGKGRVNTYALGGLLTCGVCGNGMSGITRTDRGGKQYYVCNLKHGKGRYTTAGVCDSKYFDLPEVDTAVWGWVKSILLDPERLQSELQAFQEEQMVSLGPFLAMITANEGKIEELEKEKARLIKAYAAGVLSLDDIAEQKTDLERRLATLRGATEELRAELHPKVLSVQEIESIHEIAGKVREGVDIVEDDPQAQQDIFRLLNMRVTLHQEGEQRWADVNCILGSGHVTTAFSATNSPGIFPRPIPTS